MEASLRPWFTSGVALVGASAIAMAPISPITLGAPAAEVRAVTATVSTDFQLTALDWPYVLSLPIVREQIRNWAENWGVYLAGLGKAGIGVVDSLLAIPGVTVEIIQEVFALNFVGAFDTFATAVRDSVIAIGQPLLDSVIWRNQKALLVQAALESAIPRAWIDLANGFLTAGNVVTTSLIQGTQDFVAAVLTFNLANIVDATVEGTKNFFAALGDGAGSIIAGIEAAQRGIVAALATTPPPPPTFDYSVSNVSGLSALGDNTVSFSRSSGVDTLEQPAAELASADPIAVDGPEPSGDVVVAPPVEETVPETDVVDTVGETDSEVPETPKTTPVGDISDDEADPVDEPKTPKVTPVKVKDLSDDDDSVKNVTTPKVTTPKVTAPKATGPEKGAGADNDNGAKNDAGSDTKSSESDQ